ncbi:MAG: site-specific integrase [Alistipes sp.]|nr:site-specific integrase [Alistipes sp.]
MATVRIKYRPSIRTGKEGTVYYRITHKQTIRQITTPYRIFREEWDAQKSEVALACGGRELFLRTVREHTARDTERLRTSIGRLETAGCAFTADDIVDRFLAPAHEGSFVRFMEELVARLQHLGKIRTSETYAAAAESFMRFRGGRDLLLDEIDSDLMVEYQTYLRRRGLAMNTVSFYNRILRAAYNRAVEKGLAEQRHPFRHVYTGVDKTVKRAIPLQAIRRIKNLDLSARPSLEFARDMFLFSFYTRGMSFVDMAHLRKQDLRNGILSYRRRKTGQQLFIKWEQCMQEIAGKHAAKGSDRLLAIIRTPDNALRQYRNALRLVNNKLKTISAMAGLQTNLTMYVSRHSWASIARSKHVPVSVISEGMGHDSEATTQIYLASLDNSLIDRANSMILKNL